jgi:hypothetical protein
MVNDPIIVQGSRFGCDGRFFPWSMESRWQTSFLQQACLMVETCRNAASGTECNPERSSCVGYTNHLLLPYRVSGPGVEEGKEGANLNHCSESALIGPQRPRN